MRANEDVEDISMKRDLCHRQLCAVKSQSVTLRTLCALAYVLPHLLH